MTNIYGLFDPREPYTIWYVGKGLAKRAGHHWKEFLAKGTAENARQRRWFEKLRAEGIEPSWRFLEENVVDWQKAERKHIFYWRFENPNLCNVFSGGNCWPIDTSKLGAETTHKLYSELIPVWASKAGKIGGRNGALRMHELHPEIAKNFGRNVHDLYPNLASETMLKTHKKYPNLAHDSGSKGGPIGCHQRWHVKRGIVSPQCLLCRPEFFDLWEGGNV